MIKKQKRLMMCLLQIAALAWLFVPKAVAVHVWKENNNGVYSYTPMALENNLLCSVVESGNYNGGCALLVGILILLMLWNSADLARRWMCDVESKTAFQEKAIPILELLIMVAFLLAIKGERFIDESIYYCGPFLNGEYWNTEYRIEYTASTVYYYGMLVVAMLGMVSLVNESEKKETDIKDENERPSEVMTEYK